jgi:hypothetical protein
MEKDGCIPCRNGLSWKTTMRSQWAPTISLGFCLGAAFCQTPLGPNPGPVEAELIAPLNVRHITPGATVFARVTLDWQGLGCTLRTGSILEATIEATSNHTGRSESELALSFTKAQCNGPDSKPLNLIVAAAAQPPADWENNPSAVSTTPMAFVRSVRLGNVNTAVATPGAESLSISGMRLKVILHTFPMNNRVRAGDVIGIKGLSLGVGTGPNQSSVFTAKRRDVSLGIFTQLLLIPAAFVYGPTAMAVAPPSATTAADAPSEPAPVTAPPIPENDLEGCAPPSCAIDVPLAAPDLAGRDAASISILPLGYKPRPSQMQIDFGNEETLTWLNSSHLLFAFNPHLLIERSATSNLNAPRRVIRALLLDVQKPTVARTIDWEITDTRRFLWPIDGNRILVHVGNELRIYNENLEVEREISLTGPLSFVRIAPSGGLMAIATLRERHSAELHARLQEELGREPEEDVDVSILDNELKAIGRTSTVSGLRPPTLLNEGQVNLLSEPNLHYHLALNTWDDKTVTLARFTSGCSPELSSVAPDLLFLVTCSATGGTGVYRVIRADGKVLLRGEASPGESGQEIVGDHRTGIFAIKAVRSANQLSPGVHFRATDLESEEIRVYSAEDGKRLHAVRVQYPSASYGSYAVSPDGAQLAVLSQTKIQLISLAPEPSP